MVFVQYSVGHHDDEAGDWSTVRVSIHRWHNSCNMRPWGRYEAIRVDGFLLEPP